MQRQDLSTLFTGPTGKDLEQVIQCRYGFLGRRGVLYQTFASGILEIFTKYVIQLTDDS